MPATSEPTDDDLREKMRNVREAAARAGVIPNELEPLKLPRAIATRLAKVPMPDQPPPEMWEPTCVRCDYPLGYFARRGYYATLTECQACRMGSMSSRLRVSGIPHRELEEPLSELILPSNDPRNAKLTASELLVRENEFRRYILFLRRFAALIPGQRLEPPFAFVYGSVGTGKSAGVARAMRDAIKNGCAGRVVRFSDLLRKIYESYRRDESSRDYGTEDLVRLYSSVHLLAVDEIGPDVETDHALGLFFDFIDARYGAMLPTILVSNYSPDEQSLGQRIGQKASDDVRVHGIIDRITGGAGENVFHLRGPSWRR